MTAPEITSFHLPIDAHDREVVAELQSMLVELIDLALMGKQAHWNVEGPHFRSLHLELDELVDTWRPDLGRPADRGRGHAREAALDAAGAACARLTQHPSPAGRCSSSFDRPTRSACCRSTWTRRPDSRIRAHVARRSTSRTGWPSFGDRSSAKAVPGSRAPSRTSSTGCRRRSTASSILPSAGVVGRCSPSSAVSG
jgi:hypothetical protein